MTRKKRTKKEYKKGTFAYYASKTWDFIWHSDSMLSWAVNVILAFVLIKFIIYPGIGFLLGTQLPIVAVISESMEHSTNKRNIMLGNNIISIYDMCGKKFDSRQSFNYDSWWNECGNWYKRNTNITKEVFSDYKFKNGFNKGDIMILTGKNISEIEIGEIIVFSSQGAYPVIHRVVKKSKQGDTIIFETKGDNNPSQIITGSINEKNISEDMILGVASGRIPYLGYIKLWFTDFISLLRG